MNKSIFKLSILLLLALVCTIVSTAQPAPPAEAQSFPITYGSKNDGLPRRLKVRGTITQVSYAPPKCGELIFPATFAVKLDGKLEGYRHPFIYLVVPCLYQPEGAEKFLNRRVEINATKQYEKRQPCFYDIEANHINSKGLPFYCAQREELLQSVTSRQASTTTAPIEFAGTLEQGVTYRALVTCDQQQEWRTVVSLRPPFHHAARIEWLNLRELQPLNRAKGNDCQQRIVFKVVARETNKVAGQYRWNTTYRCRILAVEK
jgi:hypothetical protein